MSEQRNKPRGAFWCSIALGAVLAYPAAFGPLCWLADRRTVPDRFVAVAFAPFLRVAFERSSTVASILNWVADVGARREGAARRILCRETAAHYRCGTIDGCNEDDFEP